MKRKAFTALIPACILTFALLLSGCGGKTITAEEYVEGLYKLIINLDSESAKTLGVSENDVKKYTESLEKSVMESVNNMNETFKQQFKVSVDEDLLKACGQEYINAIKRLTCKTSLESEGDKEAKVKVSTTFLDVPTIMSNAMTKAQAKVKASEYGTSDEYNKVLVPTYVSCLKDEMAEYKSSGEENTVTVTVKKDGRNWSTDLAEFSKTISDAVIKK